MYQPLRLAKKIARTLDFHKGTDVRFYNVADVTPLARFYIVASASNERRIQGLAGESEELIEKGGARINHIEGRHGSAWTVIDADDIVIHIMSDEERARLRFDDIYRGCPLVDYSESGRREA